MFELHTSDFDPCPGRAQLRRNGAFDGVAGTALVRGLMIHNALEMLHYNWDCPAADILASSSSKTLSVMEDEGRQPSDAVMANLPTLVREMNVVLEQYIERVLPITKKWTLLGCEVPVYWQLRDDVHLSSHLDAMFINSEGLPVFWDWKWRATSASFSDLSRSLQLACYWAAIASGNGMFQLKGSPKLNRIQDDWYVFEQCNPKGAWVDLPSLKPYSRATIGTDDEGRARQFVKGDPRPLSRAIRYVDFKESQIDNIKNAALARADMLINGTAPFIPQGCSHCECEPWCPRFDMEE
jgi:hypothetical protein